jgi:hypothetical protein
MRPIRILLQTTITATQDDWSILRFSKLAQLLRDRRRSNGTPEFDVVARDRAVDGGPDPVLSAIDRSNFDELWLFAVDVGEGLACEDCDAIGRFRALGRGLMVTRDHMDLGSSICNLGGVGKAHYFHSRNQDPDPARHARDDPYTTNISWPNFHSGANGDYQALNIAGPTHDVLVDPQSPTGAIRFLPSHPHEGAVGAPADEPARVIATGTSKATGRSFNLIVAFESTHTTGRAIAQSTFHHFADYNWNTQAGAPSFVTERPSDGMQREARALADTHTYALNVARWLAPDIAR